MRRFFGLLLFIFYSSWLSAEQVLRIAVPDSQYQPLYWLDESGQFRGPLRQTLDHFASQQGLTFQYIPVPRKRLLAAMLGNEVDFRVPDNPLWSQLDKAGHNIHYSAPLLEYQEGALVKTDNRLLTLDQVSSLAVLRGFTPIGYDASKIEIFQMADMPALLNMVNSGRVDAGYVNFKVAEMYLAQPAGEGLMLSTRLPRQLGRYHLSSVIHANVIKRLNAALQ